LAIQTYLNDELGINEAQFHGGKAHHKPGLGTAHIPPPQHTHTHTRTSTHQYTYAHHIHAYHNT
jgi:hypothetical protein